MMVCMNGMHLYTVLLHTFVFRAIQQYVQMYIYKHAHMYLLQDVGMYVHNMKEYGLYIRKYLYPSARRDQRPRCVSISCRHTAGVYQTL